METLTAIKNRKSTRTFLSKEIPEEIIAKLLKAAMAAPSGMDRRPWEFYVVKSEEKKKKVIDAMPFGKYVSPIIIVTCVNVNKTILNRLNLAYCDLGAATENILLAATDLGLGTVWCAVYPEADRTESVTKALNLPKDIIPYSAIYVGYRDEEKDKGIIKDKFDESRIHII